MNLYNSDNQIMTLHFCRRAFAWIIRAWVLQLTWCSSLQEHCTLRFHKLLTPLLHGWNKLCSRSRWIREGSGYNSISKFGKGILSLFLFAKLWLTPSPHILLRVQVRRIFGPIRQDLDLTGCISSLGFRSMQERLTI